MGSYSEGFLNDGKFASVTEGVYLLDFNGIKIGCIVWSQRKLNAS